MSEVSIVFMSDSRTVSSVIGPFANAEDAKKFADIYLEGHIDKTYQLVSTTRPYEALHAMAVIAAFYKSIVEAYAEAFKKYGVKGGGLYDI